MSWTRSTTMKQTAFKPSEPKPQTGPRKRKCAICKEHFQPRSAWAKVCKPECAQALAESVRKAQERKQDRERKQALKTKRDYVKEAQIAFNGYIRARDADKSCICCNAPLQIEAVGGGFDCGHYRSVGSAPHLRFDEDNAHGQTKQCNRYGGGRAVDYRIGLIARIGLSSVERLESYQTPRHYSIDELKAIRDLCRAKLRELKTGA